MSRIAGWMVLALAFPASVLPQTLEGGKWGGTAAVIVYSRGSDHALDDNGVVGVEVALLRHRPATASGVLLGFYDFLDTPDKAFHAVVPSMVFRRGGRGAAPAPWLVFTVGWYFWHETWRYTTIGGSTETSRNSYSGPGASIGSGVTLTRLGGARVGVEGRAHLFLLQSASFGFVTFGVKVGVDPRGVPQRTASAR